MIGRSWGWLFAGALGCGDLPAAGQIVLHVTTDAPLPPAAGEVPGPDDSPPLFDRLRIDLYPDGSAAPCAGCTRDFELDRAQVDRGGASVGVVPGARGAAVRLRLFWSGAQVSNEPAAGGSIDAWVDVAPREEGDVEDRWFLLPVAAVAAPLGTREAPMESNEGMAPTGLVGSWPGARRVDCAEPPTPGEVCIPGGAYWMGNPRAEASPAPDVEMQRLVVLSPFYLDRTEVTVAAMRASGLATFDRPVRYSGSSAGTALADWCSYTNQPGERDILPVNCLNWHLARAYCQARPFGGDLPSEAQLEYVAGGLVSALYPWGVEEPRCADAVFGRGFYYLPSAIDAPCQPPQGIGGPLPVDRHDPGRSVVALPTGDVVDIVGNLEEWARDGFELYGETCWGSGIYFDPECPAIAGAWISARGGSWFTRGDALRAAARFIGKMNVSTPLVGFRCMRAAVPR